MLSPAGVNKSVDYGNKGSRNYQSVDKSFASTRSLRNNNLIVVTTNNHTQVTLVVLQIALTVINPYKQSHQVLDQFVKYTF